MGTSSLQYFCFHKAHSPSSNRFLIPALFITTHCYEWWIGFKTLRFTIIGCSEWDRGLHTIAAQWLRPCCITSIQSKYWAKGYLKHHGRLGPTRAQCLALLQRRKCSSHSAEYQRSHGRSHAESGLRLWHYRSFAAGNLSNKDLRAREWSLRDKPNTPGPGCLLDQPDLITSPSRL